MLKKYNPQFEPQNYRDNVVFSYNDPCIFIVYPAGASGDLLATIVNSHYINTGADYFGINEQGQVIFRPSDYKITNFRHQNPTNTLDDIFVDQWLFDISKSFSERNLHYSLMDGIIFSNHMYRDSEVQTILNQLSNSKVIRILSEDTNQDQLIEYQRNLKNNNCDNFIKFTNLLAHNTASSINSPRLLNIPYISLFDKSSFDQSYKAIIEFLGIESMLIRFDFIEYYLKQQSKEFLDALRKYRDQL